MDNYSKHIDPEINSRLGELFILAHSYGLCAGEVHTLACKQRGKWLEKFNLTEIDDFRTWIKNNWYRKMQILEPAQHMQLMKLENKKYSDWFTIEEKKHTTAQDYIK